MNIRVGERRRRPEVLRGGRGISTFIAVLLLMVLAVAGGVVIYAYTMGYLGGLGGSNTPGTLSLDAATCNTTHIVAYVRNIGSKVVNVSAAYVNNAPATLYRNQDVRITVGSVGTVIINGTYTVGTTYQVRLVCDDNTRLDFSVKCES